MGLEARAGDRRAARRVRRAGAGRPAGVGTDRVPVAGARPGGPVPPRDDARAVQPAVRAAAGRGRPPLPLQPGPVHRHALVRPGAAVPGRSRRRRAHRLGGGLLRAGLALPAGRGRLPRAGGGAARAAVPGPRDRHDQRRRRHLLVVPGRGGRPRAGRVPAGRGGGLRRPQRPGVLRLQRGLPGPGRRPGDREAQRGAAGAAEPAPLLPRGAHAAGLGAGAGGGADRGSRAALRRGADPPLGLGP